MLGGGPWFCASSAGALLFQQRFDLYGVFGRAGHGYAGVHFFKARHFFGGELEVEEGGVFSYALACDDFGTTAAPLCMRKRSAVCAGLLPCAAATAVSSAFSNISFLRPCPSGA